MCVVTNCAIITFGRLMVYTRAIQTVAHVPIFVNIIKRDASGSPVLNEENLKQLLINTQASNIPVAFYSICGTSRLGKSFLWNQFVRYLKNSDLFLLDLQSDEYLEKFFEWRAGDDRHTEGIFINKKPFILRTLHYDKVALFLMDTQGMFDNIESGGNSGLVVALSFFMSSLQVYNVNSKLEANHFQYSYKFSRVCKSVTKNNSGSKPLQSLMFLVRDWRRTRTYRLGLEGGSEYVWSLMEIKESQAEDQRHVRQAIIDNFESISGFLLPEPGENIAYLAPEDSTCQIKDIDPQFHEFINELFEHLTKKENIVLKTVDGIVVNGRTLYDHIVQGAAQIDRYNEVSEHFRTFVDHDYRSVMKKVVQESVFGYIANMCKEFKSHGKQDGHNRSWLHGKHESFKLNALKTFEHKPKPGDEDMHSQWRTTLDGLLDENYNMFRECVQSETVFSRIVKEYEAVLYSSPCNMGDRWNRFVQPRVAATQRCNKALEAAMKKIMEQVDESISKQCCSCVAEKAQILLKQYFIRLASILICGVACIGSLSISVANESSPYTTMAGIGFILASSYYFARKLINSYWTDDVDDFSCIKSDAVVVLSYGVVRFRIANVM